MAGSLTTESTESTALATTTSVRSVELLPTTDTELLVTTTESALLTAESTLALALVLLSLVVVRVLVGLHSLLCEIDKVVHGECDVCLCVEARCRGTGRVGDNLGVCIPDMPRSVEHKGVAYVICAIRQGAFRCQSLHVSSLYRGSPHRRVTQEVGSVAQA